MRITLAFLGGVTFLAVTTMLWAADPDSLELRCKNLNAADVATISEAPPKDLSTGIVDAKGRVPEHCRIVGTVIPQVGLELLLPLRGWNGKLIHMGSSGHGGTIAPNACWVALPRGYACLQSDTGHKGSMSEVAWADDNLAARVDWGYRATHVATIAAKAITEALYRKPIAHSYFSGCSTGGRQALQAAQKFPWDFDGIVAGAPPIRLADLYVTFAWGQCATHDANGRPLLTIADLKVLTDGALARCDMDDGVRDGVISAPLECSFRAADVACHAGMTAGCLTPVKVKAAEQVYTGPVSSKGKSLFGAGAPPGSESGGPWNAAYGGNWGIYYLGNGEAPAMYAALTESGLRTLFFSPPKPPTWTLRDFDFDRDPRRLDVMENLYDSSNPDLSRFQTAGGKLLIYHGLNDLSVLPQWVIAYYQKVERVMGGAQATQTFARLFSLPGVEHCGGGAGADTLDYLTYLEHWAEQGEAPEKLMAYHLKPKETYSPSVFPLDPSEIEFSRPVYPYPRRAKYLGRGDPKDLNNFGPAED